MLSEANVLAVMDQLLDALSVAHAQGVWHRDIKPANLIVTKAGQVKLTDFGIARLEDANLTQVSSMIGTPAYMAPEQFTGVGIDHRADLFACGVLLYRMLTGRRAFTGATRGGDVQDPQRGAAARPASSRNGARPAAFDAIVARAIAKNPADRYPDALAMRAALQAHLAHAGVGRRPRPRVILPIPRDGEQPVTTSAVSPSVASPTPTTPPAARDPALSSGASGTVDGAPAGWDPAELQPHRARARHARGPDGARDGARRRAQPRRPDQPGHRGRPPHPRRAQAPAVHRAGARRQPGDAGGLADGQRRDAAGQRRDAVPQGAPAADPLTDDFKAHVLQVVTRKMGPIARVMVKRAADASGGSRARFVHALLHAIPEADRWAVQGEINKLG